MIGKRNVLLPLFFFVLGIISILAQSVLLRELTVLFYGNELFFGISLGIWMLTTGIGSYFGQRLKILKGFYLWLVQIGLVFLLPTLLIFLRFLAANLYSAGELPKIGLSLLILSITLFLYCFPLGAIFTWGVKSFKKSQKHLVNQCYFWETIGITCGGIIFALVLSSTTFPLSAKVNFLTLKWRYPEINKSLNTQYAQIILSRASNQDVVFRDGQLAFTNQQERGNQEFINLILAFTKSPQKFLVLGNPTLTTTLNRQARSADVNFVEIDSKFITIEKEYLAKNVRVLNKDPRLVLKDSSQYYDVIILSPGNPQTLLANRDFSYEFLTQIKNNLSPNGILATTIYLPTDYQSQEALLFGASIAKTLSAIFPYTDLVVLEDQIIFVAANQILATQTKNLNPVWQNFVDYQLKNPQRREILNNLSSVNARINSDKQPSAFFYQQLFWQTMFNFKTPVLTLNLSQFLPLLLVLFFLILNFKTGNRRLGIFMASSSFVLMSLETVIIVLFQTKIGYLFSQISFIFALILSGIGTGVIIASKVKVKKFIIRLSLYGNLIIILFLLFFNYEAWLLHPVYWFSLSFLTGVPTGIVYATLNNLSSLANKPGYIYAFDLFGASLGAILTASFLLPAVGTNYLLIMLGVILLLNLTRVESVF